MLVPVKKCDFYSLLFRVSRYPNWSVTVYTFHLRPNVRYTDGTPFTAQSVKQNIEAVLANKPRHAWLDMINEIDHGEAPDELTFRLYLKHPYFPTLIELGLSRPFRFILKVV